MKTRPPRPYPLSPMDTHLSLDLYGATLCPRSLVVRAALSLSSLSYTYQKTDVLEPSLPKESLYAELPLLEVQWSDGTTSLVEDYRGILLFLDEKLPGEKIFPVHIPSRVTLFDTLEYLDAEILPFLFFPILVQKREEKKKKRGFGQTLLQRIWSTVSGAPVFPLPYPTPHTPFDDELFFRALDKFFQFIQGDAQEHPLLKEIVSETLAVLERYEYTSSHLSAAHVHPDMLESRLADTREYGT